MKKTVRVLAFLVSVIMIASLFTGCKNEDDGVVGDTKHCLWGEELAQIEDSSEIPDWTGKKLTLNYWNIDGFGSMKKYAAGSNDSVMAEIERVTGITINEKKSFDNNFNPFSTRYADGVSSDNFHTLIIGTENLEKLVQTDKLYELSDLVPQYAPNLLKVMKPEYKEVWEKVSCDQEGKAYGLPLTLGESLVPEIHEEADPSRFETTNMTYTYVWVRDDILKMIYPHAKTQNEIEEQYVATGKFTKEEMFDVTFKSLEEYTEFLRKVKALNLTVNGKPVHPIAGYDGADNWGLLSVVMPALQGAQSDIDFKMDEANKLYYDIRHPNLKTTLKTIWSWFREGLSPDEALVDNRTVYEEKINSGRYAVTSANYWQPDNAALEANGFDFKYRRVYIDTDFCVNTRNFQEPGGATSSVSFVKGEIAEKDLPQVMRFVDFMFTKAGQRLVGWGAKSAGLFTEDDNGVRKFSNADLENQIMETNAVDLILNYGLGQNKIYDSSEVMMACGWLPLAYRSNRGIYGPYYVYTNRKKSEYFLAFNPDVEHPKEPPIKAFAKFPWSFNVPECPKYQEFWKKRQTLWDALQKPLTAKNEADFDAKYEAAMKAAEELGLTSKEMEKEVNDYYQKINKNTELFK